MKKLLCYAVFLTFSLMSFGQISIDKLEKDGSRIIISDSRELYSKLLTAASFKLGYLENSDGTFYYFLSLTLNEGHISIDEGRKLLIKFKDESIMELTNLKKIGVSDYELGYNGHKLVRPDYYMTEEQINKIINDNVLKIRIETDTDHLDRKISGGVFSKNLKKFYDAIKKAKSVPNNIYEGF